MIGKSFEKLLLESDLRDLAARIRARHDEFPPQPGESIEGPVELPVMDARERKWAAEKLLRPLKLPDEEDFSAEDLLEIYCGVWNLRTGSAFSRQEVEPCEVAAYVRSAFIQKVWKLGADCQGSSC